MACDMVHIIWAIWASKELALIIVSPFKNSSSILNMKELDVILSEESTKAFKAGLMIRPSDPSTGPEKKCSEHFKS